jgi:hypothetical protein
MTRRVHGNGVHRLQQLHQRGLLSAGRQRQPLAHAAGGAGGLQHCARLLLGGLVPRVPRGLCAAVLSRLQVHRRRQIPRLDPRLRLARLDGGERRVHDPRNIRRDRDPGERVQRTKGRPVPDPAAVILPADSMSLVYKYIFMCQRTNNFGVELLFHIVLSSAFAPNIPVDRRRPAGPPSQCSGLGP